MVQTLYIVRTQVEGVPAPSELAVNFQNRGMDLTNAYLISQSERKITPRGEDYRPENLTDGIELILKSGQNPEQVRKIVDRVFGSRTPFYTGLDLESNEPSYVIRTDHLAIGRTLLDIAVHLGIENIRVANVYFIHVGVPSKFGMEVGTSGQDLADVVEFVLAPNLPSEQIIPTVEGVMRPHPYSKIYLATDLTKMRSIFTKSRLS